MAIKVDIDKLLKDYKDSGKSTNFIESLRLYWAFQFNFFFDFSEFNISNLVS